MRQQISNKSWTVKKRIQILLKRREKKKSIEQGNLFGKNHVASTCLYTLISHNIETTNITRNTVVNVRGVGHIRQKVLGADVLEVKEMGKHKELSDLMQWPSCPMSLVQCAHKQDRESC